MKLDRKACLNNRQLHAHHCITYGEEDMLNKILSNASPPHECYSFCSLVMVLVCTLRAAVDTVAIFSQEHLALVDTDTVGRGGTR